MSKTVNTCLAVILCIFALGPALSLPTLSAHRPTLSADRPMVPQAPGPRQLAPFAPLAGIAIKVKDVGSISAKFKTRAQAAGPDYAAGVAGAAGDWETKSLAAEDNYKTSVVEAAGRGRYGAGVRGSAPKYQKNATTLGPQRYQTGIGNAQDAYAQGMAPVLQTLSGLNLPPRQVKGQNQERSNIVAMALRKMKVGA